MKKVFLSVVFSFILLNVMADVQYFYVAYSTGVNIRKTASLKSELLGKIPYGTKLSIASENIFKDSSIIVDGMKGNWALVTYQNKKGYILDCYLLTIPPPKKGTKTMKDYFTQITSSFGQQLISKNGTQSAITEGGLTIKKQLYKNGFEVHEVLGYEYNGNNYFIPDQSIESVFLILRQIEDFNVVFNEKEPLPTESKKVKKTIAQESIDVEYIVEYERNIEPKLVKKITANYSSGAYYSFEIFMIEGQVVVSFSSGV